MLRSLLPLLLCAAPLLAQSERTATLGDRVRVFAPKAGYGKLTGQVVATTPDVLSLKVAGAASEVPIARDQIDRLFLSVATHRNTGMGVVAGVVVGAGAYLTFGPREIPLNSLTTDAGRISKSNLAAGIIGGAVIGGIAGFYAKSDTWLQITPAARLP